MNRISTLLLDLDDTIHDASTRVMPHLNQRMAEYLASSLDLSIEEGDALSRHYFDLYGATAKGLAKHHPEIDIAHFLEITHDISEVIDHVTPMPGAREMFTASLPIYVVSNGPRVYVHSILDATDLLPCCEAAFGIEDMEFIPKPHKKSFLNILSRIDKTPEECLLIDDVAVNVISARELGINAIWFNPKHMHCDADIPMIHNLSEDSVYTTLQTTLLRP